MKKSEKWLLVAERMANGQCPCGCDEKFMNDMGGLCSAKVGDRNLDMFKPCLGKPYWWPQTKLGYSQRVIAACFLSAMAASEEKS